MYGEWKFSLLQSAPRKCWAKLFYREVQQANLRGIEVTHRKTLNNLDTILHPWISC